MEGMIEVKELRKVLNNLKAGVKGKPTSFDRGWLSAINCIFETFTELKEDDEEADE